MTAVAQLSGGNQQKVMLSKWLNADPKLLILDEPTRGIDVGAKAEVHHMINDLAAQGMAVILISSDLPEVLAMSDRILVMREGRQMGMFEHAEATEEKVMTAAMGQGPRSQTGGRTMNFLIRRFRPEQIRELFLVFLIILIVVFFSVQIEGYFNARFVNRISTSVVVVAVLAVGQTLVFLTRNFDLSVGSIVGFTAYFVGQQLWHHPEIPPLAAVLLAIGIGMLMGSINGVLVAYGRVPSIITTIGTLAIYRSFLVEYSHAVPITTNNLPDWLVKLPAGSLFAIGEVEFRALFAILVVVVIVFQLVLSYLPFGRRLYAIGSNPDAARVAGFPAQRIVFTAFLLSGALAGLAGFMFLARFGNISVLAGIGLEFAVDRRGGGRRREQQRRVRHGLRRLSGRAPDRPAREQPVPLAGHQRVLARRHPGHADPAGGGHRLRDHRPAAHPLGAGRAADENRGTRTSKRRR